jgi:hypothetical protein
MHSYGVAAMCLAFMKLASERSGIPQLYSNWQHNSGPYQTSNPYTGFQETAIPYLKNQRTQFAVFIHVIQAVFA